MTFGASRFSQGMTDPTIIHESPADFAVHKAPVSDVVNRLLFAVTADAGSGFVAGLAAAVIPGGSLAVCTHAPHAGMSIRLFFAVAGCAGIVAVTQRAVAPVIAKTAPL